MQNEAFNPCKNMIYFRSLFFINSKKNCTLYYVLTPKTRIMKNILVSIDFDENTDLIINKTIEFANAFNAKVWLLHTTSNAPDLNDYRIGPIYIKSVREKLVQKEQQLLSQFTNQMIREGIDAEGLLIQGATHEMILEESEKLDIDLLIMGRHEHGFLFNLYFNSTASTVLNKSKTPVLVIPLQ